MKRFLIAYIAVLHVIPLASMLGLGHLIPGTALNGAFSLVAMGIAFVYAASRINASKGFSVLDGVVAAYAFISLASFLLYLQSGHPSVPVAFLYGVNNLLLPLPLFFVAKLLDRDDANTVLRAVVYSNVFLAALGLVLFYTRPDFYTTFLSSYYSESRNLITYAVLYVRLNSYVGSTAVGILSAITIALTARLKFRPGVGPLIVSLMVITALLSQQRGGITATALAVGYYLVGGQGKKLTRALSVAGALAVIGIGVVVFESRFPGVIEYTTQRAAGAGSAFSERMGSYLIGWNYFLRFPFGLGLGATSSSVYNAGLIVGEEVTDAQLARILADLGIVGLTTFLVLLATALHCAWRTRERLGWLTLLGIYILVCIGTNVFDVFYVAHLFWMFTGIIDAQAGAAGQIGIGRRLA